ncbi:cell division protein FtsL [Pelagibacterales bacterium SAG-MED09]|nr:cell division protein FtsL [Pelagibacterales bacterium SAG-MED09]
MKKFIVLPLILGLIICTTLIKNSTKDLDEQIYSIKENIFFLEDRLKDSKLEFDYLSSSEKLVEYQKLYFENSLIKKSLDELKILKINDNKIIVNDLKISGN